MKSFVLNLKLKSGQTIVEHHTCPEGAQAALFAAFRKHGESLVGYSIKSELALEVKTPSISIQTYGEIK